MSGISLIYPVGQDWPITQTYQQHIERAKANGWCSKPGNCPSGIYYYGGWDIGCPVNTPVYAAASGRVEKQNQGKSGYGLNIRITHKDGFYTICAHFSKAVKNTGEDAAQGELIGYSGGAKDSPTSGYSSGPHIHFEMRLNGIPIDPAPYFGAIVQPEPEPEIPGVYEFDQLPADPFSLIAEITTGALRIRKTPTSKENNVIGSLVKGTRVYAYAQQINSEGRWLFTERGWIYYVGSLGGAYVKKVDGKI